MAKHKYEMTDKIQKLKEIKKGEMIFEADARNVFSDKSILDTLTVIDRVSLESEKAQKIWEESMRQFEPADLTSFVVERGQAVMLYEVISHPVPTEVRGQYFVEGGLQEHKIDVLVVDEERNVLFKRQGETQGILVFSSTEPGEYTFVFSNFGDSHYDKTVTFALHTYEDTLDPYSFEFDEESNLV
jgi:hypothetical protein